ncbi:VOC family protein [Portibacter marinus]|uniref:VOC family protein n=1 Tax=Portibacter marinus TaxID=2898660 RepID=UPI001F3D0B28|nr:VOC family protein [Portibacter marinus]
MEKQISPCLWFNSNAREAAEFHCQLFNGEIFEDNGLTVQYKLNDRLFTALNGGPQYEINEAISFMVYCGSDQEIERIYERLLENGKALMELGAYPWTRKYAWVKDQYGVSWQLDVDTINNAQNIVPSVMFVNDQNAAIDQALDFYHRIFPTSSVLMKAEYEPSFGMPEGAIQFAQHKLNGNIFSFMSSHVHHDWNINEAISFVLRCDDQDEMDHYWSSLIAAEAQEGQCGWLKDKYGVSWQVIPKNLGELLQNNESVERMLKMKKIVIADL